MPYTFTDLKKAIDRRVDDVTAPEDALEWINAAISEIGQSLGANFPLMTQTPPNDVLPFPDKWYTLVVYHAAASFKEYDQLYPEAQAFMQKFNNQLQLMQTEYAVPAYYSDRYDYQQFIVGSDPTNATFKVTKPTFTPWLADAQVFVNDVLSPYVQEGSVFTLPLVTLNPGDKVTITWEIHTDLVEPPYNWWNNGKW